MCIRDRSRHLWTCSSKGAGPLDEFVQKSRHLGASSSEVRGLLDELVQRYRRLWTSSSKGAWAFGRARPNVPGPLEEL
eukprot:9864435-Alexandrium_andersonii.AAC.1